MRKHALLTATALGFALSAPALGARAATSVTTATTAPVVTSTAGDVTVSSAGSITLTEGTAITLDSDNILDFEGAIDMSASASGSTGILITDVPGRTAAITITGDITVTDDFDAEDTNDDDVTDAPFAEGTGRYGIRSTGASAFSGDIDIQSGSVITVNGNASYGIRFENGIAGNFTYDGATTVIGDNSTGVALDQAVSGNVYLSGSVSLQGQNSRAVVLSGDVGGSVILDGTYSGTGYSTALALDADVLAALDPALNLLQSGPLVSISGNVANGILFGASVTSEDDDNTDEDGDGLTDTDQSTASLIQYGGAPAFLLGSSASDLTIGGLTYASTALEPPAINYGLLIRGGIYAYGIYSGVDTTSVQIGGLGHAVTLANGIGIAGTVATTAYGANATALALQSGATTPRLDVTGAVTAATTTATTSVTDDDDVTTYTTVGGGTTARAIDIAAGASLPTLTVGESAYVTASATGSTANATAIRDLSGTLTSISNSGFISATITASDDDGDDESDTITGSSIAIDARANTSGITLTQTDTAPDDDDISAPYISGQILLGSGNDHVSADGGAIYGRLDFAAGTGSFTLTGAATYAGRMTSSGDIAMDIDGESTALLLSGTAMQLSSLHVGDGSILGLTLDPDAATTPLLVNSGVSTFDDGAELNLTLGRIVTEPISFTVMTSAGGFSLGDIVTTTRDGYVPYLYHAELETNAGNTTLSANFRLKTQGEAGYSDNQYAALMPVLAVAAQDAGAEIALLGETTKSGFDRIYNQYLPDYSGESLLTLSLGAQSLNRSLSSLTVVPGNDGGQYWLQEYGYKTKRDSGATAGFDATAFSFAGGRETKLSERQMAGIYVAYTASSPNDSYAIASEVSGYSDFTAGGYWRVNAGAFKGWAHAGAGFVQLETTRNLLGTYVSHVSKAKWNGYSLSAGAGASYTVPVGSFALTPEWLIDYYGLTEDQHTETGGGDYFDLTVAEREGHLLSSTALLKLGYTRAAFKPELWVGYKQNISATIADTVANFAGGDAFTLNGGNIEGGGPVAGLRVSVDNEYSYLALEAEYEQAEGYSNASISLRTRFQF